MRLTLPGLGGGGFHPQRSIGATATRGVRLWLPNFMRINFCKKWKFSNKKFWPTSSPHCLRGFAQNKLYGDWGGWIPPPLISYAFTQHKTHKQSAKLKIFSIYRWFLGQKIFLTVFTTFCLWWRHNKPLEGLLPRHHPRNDPRNQKKDHNVRIVAAMSK